MKNTGLLDTIETKCIWSKQLVSLYKTEYVIKKEKLKKMIQLNHLGELNTSRHRNQRTVRLWMLFQKTTQQNWKKVNSWKNIWTSKKNWKFCGRKTTFCGMRGRISPAQKIMRQVTFSVTNTLFGTSWTTLHEGIRP